MKEEEPETEQYISSLGVCVCVWGGGGGIESNAHV